MKGSAWKRNTVKHLKQLLSRSDNTWARSSSGSVIFQTIRSPNKTQRVILQSGGLDLLSVGELRLSINDEGGGLQESDVGCQLDQK